MHAAVLLAIGAETDDFATRQQFPYLLALALLFRFQLSQDAVTTKDHRRRADTLSYRGQSDLKVVDHVDVFCDAEYDSFIDCAKESKRTIGIHLLNRPNKIGIADFDDNGMRCERPCVKSINLDTNNSGIFLGCWTAIGACQKFCV